MKFTFQSKKAKCIARFFLAVLLMSFVITLFSCTEKNGSVNDTEEKEQDGEKIYLLEKGFKIPESNIGRMSNITCGYRSENTVFDINNVTLSFFYGGNFEEDISDELQMQSYPFFHISLINEKGNEIYINSVYEEFVSEKYRSIWEYYLEEGYALVTYNYSEEITIPKTLFVSDTGTIILSLTNEIFYFADITLFYQKNGETVTLSAVGFE